MDAEAVLAQVNLIIDGLRAVMDKIQTKLESFVEILIGLSHDVKSLEEKADDLKKSKEGLWKEVNDLRAELNAMKVDMGTNKSKNDLVYKIITTLALGALSYFVFKGKV